MLLWTCPECGRECSPEVRECPACAKAQQAVQAVQAAPVLTAHGNPGPATRTVALAEAEPKLPGGETIDSLVRPLVESVIDPRQLALPGLEPLLGSQVEAEITSLRAESTPATTAAVPAEAPVEPAAKASTEATQPVAAPVESPVVAPATESTEVAATSKPAEAPVEPAVVTPVTASTEATPVVAPVEPAIVPPAIESTEVATASAPAEAPVEPVVAVTASTEARQPVVTPIESPVVAPAAESTEVAAVAAPAEAPVEPLVVAPVTKFTETARATPTAEPKQPAVAPAESAPPVAASSEMATAAAPAGPSVQPVLIAPPVESTEAAALEPSIEPSAVVPAEANNEASLAAALKLQAEAVLEAIALQAEVDQSGILAIRESFRKPPKTSLLPAARKLVTAPAPPAEQWKRTARPAIPSCKPNDPKPALLASGPQTSTLAGPCLPRELRTFIDDRSSAQARNRTRAGFPTWIVSVVVATFLFLGAGSLLQYVTGNRDAKAAAPASSQSSAATPVGDRHPSARFVEVTGLRVIADPNHKSQLQYIVVNHSSTQISGMAIKIAVRSAGSSAEAAPLFVVSASVPSLAPYQSKEIRTDLAAELRSATLPDWENLRADVQITQQE